MRAGLRRRLPDIGAWLVLALATLIVCWPLGLTNRILAGIDAFTYFTPYWAHRMEALRGGHIPLWNPYLFSGVPFLANIQAAVLYPLHWPLSWLEPERALVWSALLHAWLAAGFTYILATRSLRVRPLAGVLAGLMFGLGGFTLARVENINQLNALAWLPAMLWLYDETVRGSDEGQTPRRRLISFIALAVVIALQILAGHTQTTFINMVGLGLWAVASLGWPLRGKNVVRLLPLLAILPALALSAAQLLPTLELNGLGLRTGGLDFRQAVSFSLRPQLLLQTFLPPFGGRLDAAFGSEGYAEFTGYVGITGLLLGLLGVTIAWRRARSRAPDASPALRALLLALAGAFLALGAYNPVYYPLWRFVPGFDLFRAPARWLELFALGVALLAAYGLDHLDELAAVRPYLPRRTVGKAVAAVVLVVILALLAWQRWPAWATVVGWVMAGAMASALIALGVRQRGGLEHEGLEHEGAKVTEGAKREDLNRERAKRGPRSSRFALRVFGNLRAFVFLILTLLFLELLLASRALPFTQATAPMAAALRNAPAALLAATADQPPGGRDRFLSLSNIRYDPGDLAELRALQADRLPAAAVERLVRAAKQVEVLAPNLPLFFRLSAVDGYDGGLLPLHRYVMLQEVFLPPDRMTPDGRLAEQLGAIPDARLLDLTGVRFVITDKQRDLWAGDVYYDLEQSAIIPPGQTLDFDLTGYPAFEADALGVVGRLSGEGSAGRLAAVAASAGRSEEIPFTLPAAQTDPPQPVIAPLAQPITPTRLAIRNGTASEVVLQGLSLIDRRTGAHTSITVSPNGDFRRIHSGDVKIYERLGAPGRAWLVHGVTPVRDAADAQAAIAGPTFAPRAEAVVEAPLPATAPAAAQPGESVIVSSYEDERASYVVEAAEPGLLVVADAWYPGWRATVDGKPVEILRANLLYRAVPVEPGRHEVVFEYAPASWRAGAAISLGSVLLLLAALFAAPFIRFAPFLL